MCNTDGQLATWAMSGKKNSVFSREWVSRETWTGNIFDVIFFKFSLLSKMLTFCKGCFVQMKPHCQTVDFFFCLKQMMSMKPHNYKHRDVECKQMTSSRYNKVQHKMFDLHWSYFSLLPLQLQQVVYQHLVEIIRPDNTDTQVIRHRWEKPSMVERDMEEDSIW